MKIRKCRKCEEIIPNRVHIDGKCYVINNRKFCLTCSPFKNHNTSAHGPKNASDSKQNNRDKYQSMTSEQKKKYIEKVYERGTKRKNEFISLKGGKCMLCGYSKCSRALCFHHRDPQNKLFSLTMNILWSKNISELYAELEKCDLLCCNCHMELENDLALKTRILS